MGGGFGLLLALGHVLSAETVNYGAVSKYAESPGGRLAAQRQLRGLGLDARGPAAHLGRALMRGRCRP